VILEDSKQLRPQNKGKLAVKALRNMKIGRRLGVGFGVVVLLLLGASIAGIWGLTSLNNMTHEAIQEAHKVKLAAAVAGDVRDIGNHIANILLMHEPEEQEKQNKELLKAREDYKKAFEELKSKASTQTGKDLLSKLEQAIVTTRDVNLKIVELAMSGKADEATELYVQKCAALFDKVFEASDNYAKWREQQLDEIDQSASSRFTSIRLLLFGAGFLAIAAAVIFGALITRSIVGPVKEGVNFATAMAEGDMTRNLSIEQKDEIGQLAEALNNMGAHMRRMITEISTGVQTLASSSTELSTVSGNMASGVKDMSQKANTVAAAAEESSANTTSVAAGMEQAATNLASVASATEQMSATVGEIASNSEKARAISSEAMQQAQAVSAMMRELGRAAQEIGQVTETITSISAQTNLLALNATIEAARAGAAGKGFAVVANEIKELAQQTASATEDIKGKISNIQASTGGAMDDIEKIGDVIKQVSEIVSTIAAAIEEQSVVTRDVAGNIAQASSGVQDSNERVAQTAAVSHSIAQDIAQVNSTISEISHGGEQVQFSATDLSMLAEQLKEMVGRFRV
jgi:methyl-accepting chemotaxis protein